LEYLRSVFAFSRAQAGTADAGALAARRLAVLRFAAQGGDGGNGDRWR
jgi:hypothetical protein